MTFDTPDAAETQSVSSTIHSPRRGPGRPRKPKLPKRAFDAQAHASTMASIKGIPRDRRNAVRDEAISRVMRDPDIRASHKVIFAKLAAEIQWKDGQCWRSNAWLARECGTSKRNAEMAMAAFRNMGLVSRRERKNEAGDYTTSETTLPAIAAVWTEMRATVADNIRSVGTEPECGQPSDSPSDSDSHLIDSSGDSGEVSALRADHSKARGLSDEFCKEALKRLTRADLGKALAGRLKRNARGLGLFLAAQAAEHGTTPEQIVETVAGALTRCAVTGKPVEGEAELNCFADPDDLYGTAPAWIATWGYFAGHVADEVDRLSRRTGDLMEGARHEQP
jgi:hypothetical protein